MRESSYQVEAQAKLLRCVTTMEASQKMTVQEDDVYQSIINVLKTSMIDLEYCYASKEAFEALENVINICQRDLITRKERRLR